MRRVKIRNYDDLMSLPEGEWVDVPDGLDFDSVYMGRVRVARRGVVIDIPEDASQRLKVRPSETLCAKVEGGKLVVEKRKRKTGRAQRGTRSSGPEP